MKDRYLIFMIILFLLSNLLNTYLSYQEIIIGFLMYVPVIYLYSLVVKKHNMNIYDAINNKILSKILILIYLIFYIYILLATLNEYIIFMKISNVINCPSILVLISLIIVSIYGIKSVFKLSQSLLFISSIILIIILLISLRVDYKNILPIFNNLRINGFYRYLEMFFIIYYMPKVKRPLKASFIGVFIAFITYMLFNILVMLILGESISYIIKYPFYNATAVIDFSTFVSRIESISIVILLSSVLIKILICLDLIKDGLKRFRINDKIIYIILIFIMSFGLAMKTRINDIYFVIPGIIIPLLLYFKKVKTV